MLHQRVVLLLAVAMMTVILMLIAGITASQSHQHRTVVPLPTAVDGASRPTAQAAAPTPVLGYGIAAEQAITMALHAVPEATLLRPPKLVSFQGVAAYEVLLNRGAVYVDAQQGSVLYNSASLAVPTPATDGAITPEQAAVMARAYVGGGTVREVELDQEHGMRVYEVKFADDSKVYVDVRTGQVVYARLSTKRDDEEQEHEE